MESFILHLHRPLSQSPRGMQERAPGTAINAQTIHAQFARRRLALHTWFLSGKPLTWAWRNCHPFVMLASMAAAHNVFTMAAAPFNVFPKSCGLHDW